MPTGKPGCSFPNCPNPTDGVIQVWAREYVDGNYKGGSRKQRTMESIMMSFCRSHLISLFDELSLTLPNPAAKETRKSSVKKPKGKNKDAQKR